MGNTCNKIFFSTRNIEPLNKVIIATPLFDSEYNNIFHDNSLPSYSEVIKMNKLINEDSNKL